MVQAWEVSFAYAPSRSTLLLVNLPVSLPLGSRQTSRMGDAGQDHCLFPSSFAHPSLPLLLDVSNCARAAERRVHGHLRRLLLHLLCHDAELRHVRPHSLHHSHSHHAHSHANLPRCTARPPLHCQQWQPHTQCPGTLPEGGE